MGSKDEYEFLGPVVGPAGIMVALPLVCYGLVYICNADGCLGVNGLRVPGFPCQTQLISAEACLAVVGWMTFQIALHLALPGKVVEGVLLPNGKRLKYKLTVLQNLVVTLLVAAIFSCYLHVLPLSWIYHNFIPLLTAAFALSCCLSVYVYISSFSQNKLLASGGNTDYAIYNFFIGRELNPRVKSLDLKHFFELYPGMIGWLMIDLGMLQEQYKQLGYVTSSMWLVCCFQFLYVVDALWYEKAILSTMDIVHDGLGFMLVFGDLVWVPFTYSLQARYLVDHPQVKSCSDKAAITLPTAGVVGVLALKALGYLAFRGANSQKDTFRRDPEHPSIRHLQSLQTERGTRLITSGWWGVARHINYTGDWLMAWSWCLPCGFGSIVPYFYVIYFAVLLVHRELRDEHACKKKYGKDWDKYKAIVKYRLIPFLY